MGKKPGRMSIAVLKAPKGAKTAVAGAGKALQRVGRRVEAAAPKVAKAARSGPVGGPVLPPPGLAPPGPMAPQLPITRRRV